MSASAIKVSLKVKGIAAFEDHALTSKSFVFAVGKKKKEIIVHVAIIARCSDMLKVLMRGEKGRAVLEDVDEDTFVRFCQFAYTGDYKTPCFEQLSKSEGLVSAIVSRATPNCAYFLAAAFKFPVMQIYSFEEVTALRSYDRANIVRKTAQKKMRRQKQLMAIRGGGKRHQEMEYETKHCDISSIQGSNYDPCVIVGNQSPLEDFTPILIGHAQLYVFAKKYAIDDLMIMSLGKLRETLNNFTLYEARLGDIIRLAEYAYTGGLTSDAVVDPNGLRSSVIDYIAHNVENLTGCAEFRDLLQREGPFAKDLLCKTLERFGY